MSYETIESVMFEIQLCLENDGEFYRSQRILFEKNILKRLSTKNFDNELSKKGWLNLVESYLRKYAKENKIENWYEILDRHDRKRLAEKLSNEFIELARSGEYDGVEYAEGQEFDSSACYYFN